MNKIKIAFRQISRFTDLMKTIQKVLISSWGKDQVRFTAAYPKTSPDDSIPCPVITYRMKRKVPAGFKSVNEIKPRVRETIISDGSVSIDGQPIKGEAIEIWAQMFDYTLEFQIWAEDGEQADDVAEKFQEFMFKYTGYLKKLGVSEIIFIEATSDQETAKWRSELINRNLVYLIRMEETLGARCPAIENIDFAVSIMAVKYETEVSIVSKKDIENAAAALLEKLDGKIEEYAVEED